MLKLLSLRLCVIEILYISRPLSFLSSNLSTSFHREERREQKIQARRIADCSEGEIPDLDQDDEDDEDVDAEIKDGDRIFATGLHQPSKEIQATSTISQRLAEAFKRNQDSPDAKRDTPILAEDIPVIGHENAHARMSAFLAIISAIFTKLLQLKWSETDNCIRCWDSDSVSAVANDEEPWCCVP